MNAFAAGLKLLDPFVIAFTGLFSYYLRFDDLELPANYRTAILVVFALTIVVFVTMDVYRWRPDEGLRRGLTRLVAGWCGIMVALVLLLYATKTGSEFSRQWLGVWAGLAFLSLIFVRIIAIYVLRALHRRGYFARRIAIAGAGRLGQEIARRLARAPELGVRVVAFFDDAPELAGATPQGVPVRGTVDELRLRLRDDRIEQVWIALPLRASDRVTRLLHDLVLLNVKVRFVPDIFGFQLLNHSFTEICGLPVVNISESPFSGLKGALKWIEDKLLALIILAFTWPLMILIALAIKIDSRGPVLFRQERVGQNGRIFVLNKFRSMRADAEDTSGPVWAILDDPRITRVGKWLRRTRLDELPQFLNVLVGDMSFIGPRPERPEFVRLLQRQLPFYVGRHSLKPGITGWAQVRHQYAASVEDSLEKLQYDLYYVKNLSPLLDLLILLSSVQVILFGRGAR